MITVSSSKDHQASTSSGKLTSQRAEPAGEPSLSEIVRFFKLFSDETRLRIVYFLQRSEEMHVQGICNLLEQTQPAVSHHLALLRSAGLIAMRRDGKHNYYHLVPDRFSQLWTMIACVSPEGAALPKQAQLAAAKRKPDAAE